jgi:hypothetical protein
VRVTGGSVQRRVDEMGTVRTQAGQSRDRGEQPPDRVGYGVGDEQWRLTRNRQSRGNRNVVAETDTIAVGALTPIRGDRQPRRSARDHVSRIDAESIHHPRPRTFDHQRRHDRSTLRNIGDVVIVVEVDDDASLVDVQESKNCALPPARHRVDARPRPFTTRAPACASKPPREGPPRANSGR